MGLDGLFITGRFQSEAILATKTVDTVFLLLLPNQAKARC
jgi:hypothetical protein